jgi:hypothetical protein
MKKIDKLIEKIADKMYDAIEDAKCDDRSSCYICHEFDDGSSIEIESENSSYRYCYNITFYPADEEREGREYPNLQKALDKAMPDWDDVEIEREYDEWNEHGFRDAADYYHWRYG